MESPRQLAAIMFTDIVGFTALMQEDEARAVSLIKHYNNALTNWVEHYKGRIANYYGDGSLCLFNSLTDAVLAARAIQEELKREPRVPLRVGLHIGEVFFENGNALGDAVNIASRVQSIGQENTILLSAEAYDKIRNNPSIPAVSLGRFEFKNVKKPVEVFALSFEELFVPQKHTLEGKLRTKKPSGHRLILYSLLGLLGAVGVILVIPGPMENKGKLTQTIAILPFTDLSPDGDQRYFGDGLAEEIINSLYIIPEIKVIGQTSSFRFRDENTDLDEIKKKLDADLVLKGSIQKAGDSIRITAQLIRVKDNINLWSQKYDRKLTDDFQIQDDIALNIARRLKVSVTDEQEKDFKKNETDPETYKLYLKGLYAYRKEEFKQSIDYFKEAIESDPDYAPPYAYMSLARTWIISQSKAFRDSSQVLSARQYALQAIELSPTLAEAHSALALIAWRIERNFPEARKRFERSIALNPNASLLRNRYGYFLLWMGDTKKAREMGSGAIETDPIDYNGYVIMANANLEEGNFDESLRYIREGDALFPDRPNFKNLAIQLHYARGDYNGAIRLCDTVLGKKSDDEIALTFSSMNYFKLGNHKKGEEVLNKLRTLAEGASQNMNFQIAQVFAARKQTDSAIRRLKQSFAALEPNFVRLKATREFDYLRDHPEFRQLYRDYGFENY